MIKRRAGLGRVGLGRAGLGRAGLGRATLGLVTLCAILLAPVPGFADTKTSGTSESDRLNAFFARVHEDAVARWPEWQTNLGLKTNYDQWNDRSEARSIEEHEITIRNLTALRQGFDFEALDETAKLSYRLFERGAEIGISWFPFRHHGYPVTHLHGMHLRVPSFLANDHRVDDKSDAEAYIARLEGVPKVMAQTVRRLERRASKGIIAPRFVYPQVLEGIDRVITGAPFADDAVDDSPILGDFRGKVTALDLPSEETDELLARAEVALIDHVAPAYRILRDAIAAQQARADNDGGAWRFPDGEAFYDLALRSTTTTDLSADEIHDYGLTEVARIQEEMLDLAAELGVARDLEALFAFARSDPSNFYPNNDEGRAAYLADTRALIAEMEKSLDKVFDLKPKADLIVKRVEPYREKTVSIAFYRRPSPYGDRPGMYYVNLADMSLMPKSHLEALAYHEAVPGHHMQIAIAQELEGLPEFRKLGGNTAYLEGWALYAERLGKEMGFYRTPLSDFGRLAWELLRAARLVVDTGLHAKRWSREEAIAYLDANLPTPHETNRKSIDRYLVWPAQATAYKVGMRKMLELRRTARQALGPTFDLKDFHRVILASGALPLDILEEQIEAWIASE